MRRSSAGGILAGLLISFTILVCAVILITDISLHSIRVRHEDTSNGGRVEVDTPIGSVRVDARDKLDPESVGIPVYPGADREYRHNGGAIVDLAWNDKDRKSLSIVTADYTTSDPPEKVREFYRARLPHWIFEQKLDGDCKIEYSHEGYKRVIAINEQRNRTHIAIAAVGDPPVN